MKILLTGATGYLGSHLAHAFLQRGDRVVAVKRSSSCIARLSDIVDQLMFFDIDRMPAEEIIASAGSIDAVVHTATCYGRNGERDATIATSNYAFPLAVLEAAARTGTPLFVNTGTSLGKAVNAYALAKQQFSEWGRMYAESGRIAFVDLRLEHFYGPLDDESKFVTFVLHSCARNESELRLTEGLQERDFIYIDDVISAYRAVLDAKWTGYHALDVGYGQNVTIRHLVETAHVLTHSKTQLRFGAVPMRSHELLQSTPDLKAIQALGWHAEISLKEGLQKILAIEHLAS